MKKEGYFGNFGGRFVPEALRPPLMELEEAMDSIMPSREYRDALQDLLVHYAGRETPLTFCPHLSEKLGFRLWLKREDLLHTGAHKINNALGQALLAKMMGKTHLIAETGAGQHGVATATAAARLNMDCTIFMGAEDVERQSMNVMRMKLLGATVFPIESGSRTLKDAINEALRYWISHQADTLYCFGTAGGTGEPGCYNSAPINLGSPGVLHGHVTMLLQDKDGQIQPSHSISAGLDYPGVGPEHAYLAETGRVHYGMICDASALNAFQTLTREEGIIPALESSHAVAWVLDHAEELPQGGDVLVNLSGRGDKDLGIVRKYINL